MIRLDMLGALSLRGADGHELRTVLAQPKRLALLAYLAVESARGFQRRDRLFALFWPELDQSQARQALRQSLYFLRRSLGANVLVNRGAEEIGIAADAFFCDTRNFAALLHDGQLADALALYRGDLLAGVYIADASPAFDEWLESTRGQIREQAVAAAWKLAEAHEREHRVTESAHWARFAVRLAPDDERALRRLLTLLDRTGDRAGAARAYAEFADRLKTEFDVEPSAETRAIMRGLQLRADRLTEANSPPDPFRSPSRSTPSLPTRAPVSAGHAPVNAERTPANAERAPADAVALPDSQPNQSHAVGGRARALPWPARRVVLGTAMVAATAITAVALVVRPGHAHRVAPTVPVIAVGWIQDPSGADTGSSVRTLAELLATDLGRIPGLRVVSHARLYDMLGQLSTHDATPSAISDAARRAGATELLEAVLSHAPDRALHLDLRRVDLVSGDVHDVQSFTGATVFELADRATAQTAAQVGLRAPLQPLTAVTTTSRTAERLYEEGLRTYYQTDIVAAVRLFHAALDEDPTFAMAAYYAGLGEEGIDGLASRRDLALALRLADHASDRERLMIREAWADATNDPTELASAELLAARYPDEPGAELALGKALAWDGHYLAAVPHLKRAIHLDSLSLTGRSPRCQACDAYQLLWGTYVSADSLAAAERIAHEWTRLQPQSHRAWWALVEVLDRVGRADSALAVEQTVERLAPTASSDIMPRVHIALRSGRFDMADHLLSEQARTGNQERRSEALWWLVISLRNQGRLRDALADARELVQLDATAQPGFTTPRSLDAVSVAQVLFEMGQYHESAALFDSIGHYVWRDSPDFPIEAPGLVARHRIWMLTHVATALAAAGDTAQLPRIIDSLTAWKARSGFSRDHVLDHYARGLLLSARGESDDAATEFRRALVDPVNGYSRVNLELAKILLARNQERDAIPLLRAPLAGPIESESYYNTLTELHVMLGNAFERAGAPDSAIVHYRYVLAAWRHADPQFRPRLLAIQRRVSALHARASQ
ncbi:MAG TPA: BTAD domain-containing putative transcriptional regulator [Gemmatimonadaceae bacterium]|nr:BTAD domain-containing putative transcriptional regulator [Gemmatimonadaceae bacterium]